MPAPIKFRSVIIRLEDVAINDLPETVYMLSMATTRGLQQERKIGKTATNLTISHQGAIQIHMMKVINVDMMTDGLEKTILVLIL
jgi:hypothetical protein